MEHNRNEVVNLSVEILKSILNGKDFHPGDTGLIVEKAMGLATALLEKAGPLPDRDIFSDALKQKNTEEIILATNRIADMLQMMAEYRKKREPAGVPSPSGYEKDLQVDWMVDQNPALRRQTPNIRTTIASDVEAAIKQSEEKVSGGSGKREWSEQALQEMGKMSNGSRWFNTVGTRIRHCETGKQGEIKKMIVDVYGQKLANTKFDGYSLDLSIHQLIGSYAPVSEEVVDSAREQPDERDKLKPGTEWFNTKGTRVVRFDIGDFYTVEGTIGRVHTKDGKVYEVDVHLGDLIETLSVDGIIALYRPASELVSLNVGDIVVLIDPETDIVVGPVHIPVIDRLSIDKKYLFKSEEKKIENLGATAYRMRKSCRLGLNVYNSFVVSADHKTVQVANWEEAKNRGFSLEQVAENVQDKLTNLFNEIEAEMFEEGEDVATGSMVRDIEKEEAKTAPIEKTADKMEPGSRWYNTVGSVVQDRKNGLLYEIKRVRMEKDTDRVEYVDLKEIGGGGRNWVHSVIGIIQHYHPYANASQMKVKQKEYAPLKGIEAESTYPDALKKVMNLFDDANVTPEERHHYLTTDPEVVELRKLFHLVENLVSPREERRVQISSDEYLTFEAKSTPEAEALELIRAANKLHDKLPHSYFRQLYNTDARIHALLRLAEEIKDFTHGGYRLPGFGNS